MVSSLSQRLFFLDGLRGWAAFAVMLLHIYVQILPPIDTSRLHLHLWWPFTGEFAVALFFLVSGFSLSLGFVKTSSRRLVLRTAVGRYLRLIIPVFFACALASVFLNAGLVPPPETRPAGMDAYYAFEPTVGHLLKFAFLDVLFDYSHDISYAPPLWTISYEFFGSLLLAVLLLAFGKPSDNRLIFATAAVVFFVYQPWYYLFVVGIICVEGRIWLASRLPGWMGGALMGVGCILSVVSGPSMHLLALAATLFFVGAIHAPAARAFFSNRLSRILGELSFPLYLVHVPVAFAIGMPVYIEYFDSNLARFAAGSLAVAASVIVSVAFIPINTWAMQSARWAGRTVIRDQRQTRGACAAPD